MIQESAKVVLAPTRSIGALIIICGLVVIGAEAVIAIGVYAPIPSPMSNTPDLIIAERGCCALMLHHRGIREPISDWSGNSGY